MKKLFFMLALLLWPAIAFAGTDGHTEGGVWSREGKVLARGFLGVPGIVTEIFVTPIREHKIHPKAWPITGLIRIPTNVFVRAASVGQDIVIYPWVVPFTDDISPITAAYGLPENAWDKN